MSWRSKIWSISVSLCVLLLCFECNSFAQTSLGSISGLLRDSSGAIVPGATLTLQNVDTNQTRTTVSNDAGLYSFPSTPAANYVITVEHGGFEKYEGKLVLRVGQQLDVDIALKVAGQATQIVVQDTTPAVETASGTLSDVKESARIKQLPLNGRNIQTLFSLTPGVTTQGGTQVNGLQQGNVQFLADGVSIEDKYIGDFTRVSPALEGVQEFKVETLNSPAQFSKPATISYLTKSGTNRIHGAVFETHRNNALLARNPFQPVGAKAPFLIRNEFGAAVGGPVVIPKLYRGKDKTFFFFTYEGLRQNQSLFNLKGSPTDDLRGGDLSKYIPIGESKVYTIYDPLTTRTDPATGRITRTPFPGNIIPANRISSLAKKALEAYPKPNRAGAPLDQNLGVTLPNTVNQDKFSTKIDHQWGANDTLSGTLTFVDEVRDGPKGGAPTTDIYFNKNTARTTQGTFAETHVFSPQVVNEFRIGGTRPNSRRGPTIKSPAVTTVLGLQNVTGDTGWPCLYPYNPVDGDTEFGGWPQGLWWDDDNPQTAPQFFGTVVDNLSITRRKHNIKIGGQLRTMAINSDERGQPRGCYGFDSQWTALGDPNQLPVAFTGSGFASFLLGYGTGDLRSDKGFFYHRQKDIGLYIQDDWKVSSRLTLNLGLRYEYYTRYKDTRKQISTYDPATKSLVLQDPVEKAFAVNAAAVAAYRAAGVIFKTADEVGFPSGLLEPDRNNWGPRVGFAYLLTPKGNAVLRGGYGINYWTLPLITLQAPTRQNPPFNFTRSQLGYPANPEDRLTTVPPYVLGGGTPAFSDANVFIRAPVPNRPFSPFSRDAMAQSWNVTLEYEILPRTGLRTSYVGTHGSHLQVIEPINTPYPQSRFPTLGQQARRRDPVYGDIGTLADYGYSQSHQFQLEVKRNVSSGIIAQGFYVFQKTLNTSEQSTGSSGALPFLGDRQSGIESRDQRLRLEKGNSSFYPRQQFTLNFLIDMPFGPGKQLGSDLHGLAARLVEGWQLASISRFRSGLYFSPDRSRWRVKDGNLPADDRTINRWFDTTAFVLPRDAQGRVVDVITSQRPGRNILEGPGLANVDFAVFKNTRVTEDINVRFTADFFNLFNHPNYSNPNATSGRISSTVTDPRLIQFGLRIEF
ncbi:MAG TPA: TonB-dependent receptor [Acidobacteriota bacterium]|jgi:hypothetical protein